MNFENIQFGNKINHKYKLISLIPRFCKYTNEMIEN